MSPDKSQNEAAAANSQKSMTHMICWPLLLA